MSHGKGASVFGVVLLSLIFGALGGVGAYLFLSSRDEATQSQVVVPASMKNDDGLPAAKLEVTTDRNAIVDAVAKVAPSVVKITGRREPRNWQELWMSGGEISGVGSGFIFEYEGRKLVLTNTHVIGDFTDLTVKLTDGRELKATPLGRAREEDLAVLELIDPPTDLVAVPLGHSDKLRQGEWVIALGNPFNFEHTVTVGVVSAKGVRQIGDISRNVVQTDAAINAGNSGGPLVDLAGNVVGINFAIFDPQGNRVHTTVGIGFAIPIDQAKELLYYLVHRGPYLGLPSDLLQPNSPGFAKYFRISVDTGVVVLGLYQDGPAHKAGVRVRDVIVEVDGESIKGRDDLQKAIFRHKIGDKVVLTVQRGRSKVNVDVVAGTAPEDIYF